MDARTRDTAVISMKFADGSVGAINYFANGSKAFPKERIEIFAGGGVMQIDNFRTLRSFGWSGGPDSKLWRQDKGQFSCARAFVDAARGGGANPIPVEEIFEIAEICIDLAR